MKQLTRKLLMLGAALALMSAAPALAAGETAPADQAPVIAVQLDGETLTFPDAVPQAKDGRTFLPFRAVFEAMGAKVSNEGSVITAIRGDRTLTMTIGETNATVTTAGATLPLQMDVAPYVDTTTWRTYVPVRFAAQALGCAVGWDQEAYTAIIVDTDKLVEKALEGKEFTYLEKLAAYSEKYNEGIWDMTMDFDGTMTPMGAPMPFEGDITGTIADAAKLSMDMNIKLDTSSFSQYADLLLDHMSEETYTYSEEDLLLIDGLKNEGTGVSLRADLDAGTIYYTITLPEVLADPTMDGWIGLDMNTIYDQAGVALDWQQLMKVSRTFDYTALVKSMVAQLTPNTASEEGYGVSYSVIKESVENVVLALSDEGFTKEGNTYTTLLDSGLYKLGLTLTMKKDAITAYTMDMSMFVADEASSASMTMTTSMDDKDQMTAQLSMDVSMTAGDQAATLLGLEMNMAGGYTPGKTAPQTQPPEGARIIGGNALIDTGM